MDGDEVFTHKGKACILLVSMQGGGKGGGMEGG